MLSFKKDKTKQIECQRLMAKIINVNNPQLAAGPAHTKWVFQ